jgi:DNA-binding NarL/FixJ family response regulator
VDEPLLAVVASSAGIAPEELEEILTVGGVGMHVRRAMLRDAGRDGEVDMVFIGDRDTPIQAARSVERIQRMFPDTCVVVVLWRPERTNVRGLLAAGADAVVLGSAVGSTLAPAVRAAWAGLLTMPRELWRTSAPAVLSDRQRETVALAVAGLTNAEIATSLGLSESTISMHLTWAFRRLAVHSRTEAATLLLGAAVPSRDQGERP